MTEYLTTKELAELLRIKERKVYDLAASGTVPCTRATGKLLFPRSEIEAWLARNGSSPAPPKSRPLVIVGSHDPLLEWALRASCCGLASYFDSSLDGLDRYANGEGIASGLHLYAPASDSWNSEIVESRFAQAGVVLAQWAIRARGIIVQSQSVGEYSGLADLAGKIMVPRQSEAGSQVLLEALLERQQVDIARIKWMAPARSEVDAVIEVVEGRADAAFGLAMLADQYRLGFVPVIDERFDILVDRREWFAPTWQSLLRFCQSPAYHAHARGLAGYDIGDQFRIHFNGAG